MTDPGRGGAVVVIRADASAAMGIGHVMRCLTLAETLRASGARVSFVCRELPGHACAPIEAAGFEVERLPAPEVVPSTGDWLGVSLERDARETGAALRRLGEVDWLVVDHYGLDRRWEVTVRPLVGRIAVVDDLANRPHDCELLLDQNLCAGMERRYLGLLPSHARAFLGPRHALLRSEFREARRTLERGDGTIHRLLLFFGGGDALNQTAKALDAFERVGRGDLALDVVVGGSNPHRESLRARCAALPQANLHVAVSHMAELMARADLAIGAGGTTTWERCYLGLPAIILTLADNQVPLAEAVHEAGAAWYLGPAEAVETRAIASLLERLLGAPGEICRASHRGLELMDGNGQASTLADAILERAHVG